jgi:hypothetical protein
LILIREHESLLNDAAFVDDLLAWTKPFMYDSLNSIIYLIASRSIFFELTRFMIGHYNSPDFTPCPFNRLN